MNFQPIVSSAHILIIIGAAVSIIFTLGVVWRVEKKLDTSYKLFFASIVFFTVSEIANLFAISNIFWINLLSLGSRLFFVFFFLLGTLEMRAILRRMDGEKPVE